MMEIPESEIAYSSLSLIDIGRIFWWQGRLFRGILEQYVPLVQEMFECGLVTKLTNKGLLVGSWVTTFELEGYGLVIEHEIVPTPVYPREWSFSMLKDAALLVLELNKVASTYNYQTRDCHGYNVMFRNGSPIYVDLGSFMKVDYAKNILRSYEDFLRSYFYPLQIWESVGEYLGARVIHRPGFLFPVEDYLRYRWPVLRVFKDNSILFRKIKEIYLNPSMQYMNLRSAAKQYTNIIYEKLSKLKKVIMSCPADINNLKKKIEKISYSYGATTWSGYHDAYKEGDILSSTPRFDYMVEKLISLKVNSVVELAGNQGVLSRLLKNKTDNIRVTCTDTDSFAIDKGYCCSKKENVDINWAIHNPFMYETTSCEVAPEKRLRADAVVVLALTHHLVLSGNYDIDFVLETIGRYADKYVFVEYMPLGLFNGQTSPELPHWYSEKWFRDNFLRRFELVDHIQLEKNRILYIGKSKDANVTNIQ